ncbi:hypothetical protein K2X14_06280 [Acetobacter sp. TBRC 12305]|uniref:Uncharacterized protein n=1 Tax=Acetobacter garciniae TaxID=2817435 RepID=A0A939HN66_9PROT|nr:hypothetical protein [Acetobacter garciniae]MBO1324753.1 hypothetical protein [Acetobacter garciniae]MBX0344444.1 hypothetical protein [Acetobacter garciniae]
MIVTKTSTATEQVQESSVSSLLSAIAPAQAAVSSTLSGSARKNAYTAGQGTFGTILSGMTHAVSQNDGQADQVSGGTTSHAASATQDTHQSNTSSHHASAGTGSGTSTRASDTTGAQASTGHAGKASTRTGTQDVAEGTTGRSGKGHKAHSSSESTDTTTDTAQQADQASSSSTLSQAAPSQAQASAADALSGSVAGAADGSTPAAATPGNGASSLAGTTATANSATLGGSPLLLAQEASLVASPAQASAAGTTQAAAQQAAASDDAGTAANMAQADATPQLNAASAGPLSVANGSLMAQVSSLFIAKGQGAQGARSALSDALVAAAGADTADTTTAVAAQNTPAPTTPTSTQMAATAATAGAAGLPQDASGQDLAALGADGLSGQASRSAVLPTDGSGQLAAVVNHAASGHSGSSSDQDDGNAGQGLATTTAQILPQVGLASTTSFTAALEQKTAEAQTAQGLEQAEANSELEGSAVPTPSLSQSSDGSTALSMTVMTDDSTPVHVRLEGTDGVTTGVVLQSEDSVTARHLANTRHELVAALGAAGVDVGNVKIDIVTASQGGDTSYDQGSASGGTFDNGNAFAGTAGGGQSGGQAYAGGGSNGVGALSGQPDADSTTPGGEGIARPTGMYATSGVNITA